MADDRSLGLVHWIDHCVVATNDMGAWIDWAVNTIGVVPGPIGGLTTQARQRNAPVNCFLNIGDGPCHLGVFLQSLALPASSGLGKATPRYGFFIRPEEILEHLDRLDRLGVPRTDPVQTGTGEEEVPSPTSRTQTATSSSSGHRSICRTGPWSPVPR